MQSYFRTQSIGANKRVRTRYALIDSAIGVFAEKGVDEARISDIAALAGLANGTFYNHFKDKSELAAASAEAIAVEIAGRLDALMGDVDRGVTRVVVATTVFLRLSRNHPDWIGVLVEQYQREPLLNTAVLTYLRSDVELAVAQQKLKVSVDDFLLGQIGALIIAALRLQLNTGLRSAELTLTCENILRLIGLTPTQAQREVARAAAHPLLASVADESILRK